MRILLDQNSVADYHKFLAIKSLPKYRFAGRLAEFPDEYAATITGKAAPLAAHNVIRMIPSLFDYQRDISRLAIIKRKFAVFADCGLGKTLIMLEFARHALDAIGPAQGVLIVSPLMVIPQTIAESATFYPGMTIRQLRSDELHAWLNGGHHEIAIVNYDALHDDITAKTLGALILDESSMLKSHYGKWGQTCIRLGRGLNWKLALTGTPAPNDRIEYANHAVFLDAFPTVNSFLARFFVNRGQTDNRWELKPHALAPFYRALSHWCIFLTNPATYGWKDNCATIPPIHTHIHEVSMTAMQQDLVHEKTGTLFADKAGGITSRSVLSQIGKGSYRGNDVDTLKPAFIRALVDSWPEESTLVWCHFNREQEILSAIMPTAANISGDTAIEKRLELVGDFKARRRNTLISKGRILGFGLNLQVATRQIFSGLQDSYEEFYQCVKRSNRVGSTRPLNVHIPVTAVERPMVDTVLRKAKRVQQDTEEQEKCFKEYAYDFGK